MSMDSNSFIQLQSLMKDKFPAVIEQYKTLSLALISKLEQAIQDQNTEEIRKTAHSLYSCSAQIGAVDLASLGKQIEVKEEDAILNLASYLLKDIKSEHQSVIVFLEGYIRR